MPMSFRPVLTHDGMFKALLDEPKRVAALLQDHLPEVATQIKPGTEPQQLEGSFIDPGLRGSQSDRLYELTLKSGSPALLHLLIEHKSRPDPDILEQLARYQMRIVEKYTDRSAGQERVYPLVFPLVIYHGREPWDLPQSFGEARTDDGNPLSSGLICRYSLLDIGHIPYATLSSDPGLWAGFAALRGAFRPEEAESAIVEIMRRLPKGSILEAQLITYISTKWNLSLEDMESAFLEANPETGEQNMSGCWQELTDKYGGPWIAQGKADTLKRQLRRQFGALPQTVENRLDQATIADLDTWAERFVGAPSLDAVFSSEGIR